MTRKKEPVEESKPKRRTSTKAPVKKARVSSKSVVKRVTAQKKGVSSKAPAKRATSSKKAPAKRVVKKRVKKAVEKVETFSPETEGVFYKAFDTTPNPEVLHSPSITGALALDYPIGQRTQANEEMLKIGFGIMIFKDLSQARSWTRRYYQLYRVKVGKVFDVPRRRMHRGAEVNINRTSETPWQVIVQQVLGMLDVDNSWPEGTIMTDWVIPIEKVERFS